jgi:Holliday junction resolvase-like predicted endonuclease
MDLNVILLANCLQAISGSTMTFDRFRSESGIRSKTVANELLDFLVERGVGRRPSKSLVSFSPTDRLRASILALRHGVDIQQVANRLSWKDFERFASEILNKSGFYTMNNVRFTKPRAEIDIVASKSYFALAIDCKHWAYNDHSRLSAYARKQIQRTERLLKSSRKLRVIVPVVLTIYPSSIRYDLIGVPIVEIDKLKFFAEEIELNLEKVFCLTKSSLCY